MLRIIIAVLDTIIIINVIIIIVIIVISGKSGGILGDPAIDGLVLS